MRRAASGGTAELTVPWGEGTLPISFYGDAEELQLTLPGITDEVYSIPAHGIAEAYADSALGKMLGELGSLEDLDLFPEETARDPALSADLQDKLRTFGDSLKVTKAGTSVLTLDGRSVPVTNYDIDFSKKQLTRLCRAFCDAYEIDFTVNMGVKMSTDTVIGELIDSVRTPLHVSVDGDGMVRAWEMTTRESGTDTTVRILLAGEENPWNRIEVWTAEDDAEPEILFVCGLTGQNGLLTLAVGDETRQLWSAACAGRCGAEPDGPPVDGLWCREARPAHDELRHGGRRRAAWRDAGPAGPA